MLGLGVLLAHLLGDYPMQSDSMAQRKTSSWRWALTHAGIYTIPSWLLMVFTYRYLDWRIAVAVLVIAGTHAVIDRYRLAKHLIWFMNRVLPHDVRDRYPWSEARAHAGYSASSPVWLATWLMIIVDNTCHLVINALIIAWLLR